MFVCFDLKLIFMDLLQEDNFKYEEDAFTHRKVTILKSWEELKYLTIKEWLTNRPTQWNPL